MNRHVAKTKIERENFLRSVMDSKDEPTRQENRSGTLDSSDQDNGDLSKIKRRFFRSRFFLHIKDYWPNYLMGTVGVLALFFFVTMNVRLAEINKDISFIYMKVDDNTRKIEKVSDDVSSLREQILLYRGDLKSLDDRFAMFIELFKKESTSE